MAMQVTYELQGDAVRTVIHDRGIRIATDAGTYGARKECQCGGLNIDNVCTGSSNSAPYVYKSAAQQKYLESLFAPLRASLEGLTPTQKYLAQRNSQ